MPSSSLCLRKRAGELGARADAELGVDAREVVLDGPGRQEQRARDLLVRARAEERREDRAIALAARPMAVAA
jgi:hypothetical protein